MNDKTVLLIDLSSVAVPLYKMNAAESNPNAASEAIVAAVRRLAADYPHTAIACDSGKCFRHDVDPDYKGQRSERDAIMHHQIALAVDALRAEGFPIWAAPGFEADDVIASAVVQAMDTEDLSVRIVSADKDLAMLIDDRVVMHGKDNTTIDAAAATKKYGVLPSQMCDYLSLMGDAADNVKGAKGIGEKTAADLLARFRSLDNLYAELEKHGGAAIGLKPAVIAALRDFKERWPTVKKLITLRTDAEVPFADVLAPRTPTHPESSEMVYAEDEHEQEAPMDTQPVSAPDAAPPPAAAPPTDPPMPKPETRLATRPETIDAEVVYERQLDPRSMNQVQALAENMFRSRMFEAYGNPQAVLSTIMVGRELGLPAMTSLRCIHNIKGRHALSAQLIVALVLKSGLCEYFEMDELTAESCTWVAKRKGGRKEQKITHTLAMAEQAGLMKAESNWMKIPQDMLVARASVRLARIVAPEIVSNVYTPEELAELKD